MNLSLKSVWAVPAQLEAASAQLQSQANAPQFGGACQSTLLRPSTSVGADATTRVIENILILDQLPMPPSSNNLHVSFVRGGKLIRANAPEYVAFKKECDAWFKARADKLAGAGTAVSGWGELLVECYFFFERTRIRCKDGSAKKLDVSNRVKALHDAVFEQLGVDDKWIWQCTESKHEHPAAGNSVLMIIRQVAA